MAFSGENLSAVWAVPFVGILLSIAVMPLVAGNFWHHHYGKISAFWVAAFVIPFGFVYGISETSHQIAHAMLLEYIPFIILVGSLYVVAGGVRVTGKMVGKPGINTAIITIGALIAGWIGTTAAAMLLIRPLIRANRNRRYHVHIFVFFIFIVANIGGSLTPLGDPPLFLGFLKGVDFFWPLKHMIAPMMFALAILLPLFFVIDSWFYRKETGRSEDTADVVHDVEEVARLGIEGKINILLILLIIVAVLISGLWKPGINFTILHTPVELQNVLRDVFLVLMASISYALGTKDSRQRNGFSWFPVQEVGKLFAAIFITIIPVLTILRAGEAGALGAIVAMVNDNGQPNHAAYFWATGLLSSFLDNAPTYLVFFNIAGGDPNHLMGAEYLTLLAISAGSVFMGANTYIGNAPNFMVRSVCEEQGIRMPSFFGYMAWSGAILIPLFFIITLVFF
jgi:Na+/H+ antiporter NhaD/arsenite permease-like protein